MMVVAKVFQLVAQSGVSTVEMMAVERVALSVDKKVVKLVALLVTELVALLAGEGCEDGCIVGCDVGLILPIK